jgi:hypothetical protein
MPVDCSDPVRLFREDFPPDFLGAIVQRLHVVYFDSLALMKGEVEEEELSATWGVFRRARIEGELRGLAARHGLRAVAERNDTGSYHTVIESNRF